MFKLVIDSNTKGIDIKCLENKKAEEKLIELLEKDAITRNKLLDLIKKSEKVLKAAK